MTPQRPFYIIVLLKTRSKIQKGVMAVRLSTFAPSKTLHYPNQCGPLPGLTLFHGCFSLAHEIRILQGLRLRVSTLFANIKAAFDNVNASTLWVRLLSKHTPSDILVWVSSFLSERSCSLVFQASPNLPTAVSVGTRPGLPTTSEHFLFYVAPRHPAIPRGISPSYVYHFSITVASTSLRGNICLLQRLFKNISENGETTRSLVLPP